MRPPSLGNPSNDRLIVILAWSLFAFTCFQLTFLVPRPNLIPSERSNVFSGLLCLFTLVAALFTLRSRPLPGNRWEIAICAVLAALSAASAAAGLDRFGSSLRVFVLLSTGLGGFWTARILLADPDSRRGFHLLCSVLMGAAIIWGLVGNFKLGVPSYIYSVHEHGLNAILLLLWVGPLGLMAAGGRGASVLGMAMLAASYVVILLSRKMSAVWIPPVAAVFTSLFTVERARKLLAPGLALLCVAVFLTLYYVPGKYGKSSLSVYYRAENYPFSLHIAKKHPVLGIGLWGPREAFLEDYEARYPFATKTQFTDTLRTNHTSENIFLTFMSDLGIPFTVLYVCSLAALLYALFLSLKRDSLRGPMSPLPLVAPIVGGLLYFQLFDGLLYAQLNWFFHLLLGMISAPWADERSKALPTDNEP